MEPPNLTMIQSYVMLVL